MNVNCRSRGAQATLERLKRQLKDRGMEHVKPASIICFAACNVGPNIVIPSRRCWLSGVLPEDVPDVVAYLEGQADVAHLQQHNDPALEEMIFDTIDAGLLDKGESE
ncbi:MAG: (2Fe-2S) ferredoxin protein [Gammaproteobacteria bacterium]|nr:(2Fe-2S) ferredoxin protein [Gammaproteobacteria bacterium]